MELPRCVSMKERNVEEICDNVRVVNLFGAVGMALVGMVRVLPWWMF